MDTIKKQMIAALQTGNMEEVRRLQPELAWEIAATKWLDSHIGPNSKGSIPIALWIHDSPFIMFGEATK